MTSDSLEEKLRATLDERPDKGAVNYLIQHSLCCDCESAAPCENGFGPVARGETLSYFITHPQQTRQKVKDPKTLKKNPFPFKAAVFDAAFTEGISTMRELHATDRDLTIQAEKIYQRLQSLKPGEGGMEAVLQFKAEIIAEIKSDEQARSFCVYDTPLDVGNEEAEVLSHADIFATGKYDDFRAWRALLRTKIHAAVSSSFAELNISEYRNGVLTPFASNT